jgi:hypothetical protein
MAQERRAVPFSTLVIVLETLTLNTFEPTVFLMFHALARNISPSQRGEGEYLTVGVILRRGHPTGHRSISLQIFFVIHLPSPFLFSSPSIAARHGVTGRVGVEISRRLPGHLALSSDGREYAPR